jgi:hypothetical protein
MDRPEGWGRNQGRRIFPRLLSFVEENPGAVIYRISMKGVERLDISFASETIVELARRYRRTKGFCLVDLMDRDLIENIDAAAKKKDQPLLVWHGQRSELIGAEPSEGTREALLFAIEKVQARAAEFASQKGLTTANASMKFKQLWEQGFLLRRESVADSGGVEFIYERVG